MPSIDNIWDEGANILNAFADNELEHFDEQEASALEAQALEYLDELARQESNKIDAIGYVQDQSKNQIDFLKGQEEKIRAKRKALERAQERFKSFLYHAMKKHGIKKVKGNTRTISLRTTETVEVGEPQSLPEEYRETRVEYKPLKKKIREDLKNGEEIMGAKLVQKENVQIR